MKSEDAKLYVKENYPKLRARGHTTAQSITILIQQLFQYGFRTLCPISGMPMNGVSLDPDGIVRFHSFGQQPNVKKK